MYQSLPRPLGGQHILVTRPAGQADTLVAGIEQLGGHATHIPFLAISPIGDETDLQKIAAQLEQYRACVFISANAVETAWPVLTRHQPWPDVLPAAVVGPGTARVLRDLGVNHVLQPAERFDSEGMLALPCFSAAASHGAAFALIRGEGGRDLIASTLRDRGARVDEASVYQRSLDPQAVDAISQLIVQNKPSAMIVTSSESLALLIRAASHSLVEALCKIHVIAPHGRIAQVARALGFNQVTVCDGGDEGILRFLRTYNG
jgi:uroporphyrinogen-III synthase